MIFEINEEGCKVIIEQCGKNIKSIDESLQKYREELLNASDADVASITDAINQLEQRRKQQVEQIQQNENHLRSLKP